MSDIASEFSDSKQKVSFAVLARFADLMTGELVRLQVRCAALEARICGLEGRPKSAYRGLWETGVDYIEGDQTTCAGSLWIATASNRGTKPGSGIGWRLAVKRGRAA